MEKSKAQEILKLKAREELWRRGQIADLILKGPQKEMYEAFEASNSTMFFLLCSRRLGKTVTLLTTAVSECIQNPKHKVLFLSTTTEQVREIVDQTADVVLDTCPVEMKPILKQKENKYVFPNGSEIRVKGLDKVGGSAIRGVKAHLVVFDEACFMSDLKDALDSVVMPMVIATGGRILFGSTPPDTPGHDSIGIIARCEEEGALIKRDIYSMQGILYTEAQIKEFEKQAGGKDSTLFRREYMGEVVVETELAILPSFTEERAKELTEPVIFPTHRQDDTPFWPDTYVGMDLGFRDLTVALFGYWDYPNATLVVQDELVWGDKTATTANIAQDIIKKEKELWGTNKVTLRVCDNDPRFIEDIRTQHGLRFKRTDKDNKEAQVNMINIMINEGQIRIDPKCKTLLKHMKYGLWKENRREFQRNKELFHSDAIDALIYMVRNIKRNRNPIPRNFYDPGRYTMHDWGNELNQPNLGSLGEIKKAFKG